MIPAAFSPAEHLGHIHELNRLFLAFLSRRAREGRDCLGMSEPLRALLAASDPKLLNRVAEFPRALFDLALHRPPEFGVMDPSDSLDERARHALNLTILLSAWNLCRASAYHARLFLGLTEKSVHRLRAMSLSDLPALALARGVVRCAFPRSERFWRELMHANKPEVRHQLGLIALQPWLDRAWPGPAAAIDLFGARASAAASESS
jgi:hypothetical protein